MLEESGIENQMDDKGFAVFEGVLTSCECVSLAQAVVDGSVRRRAGVRNLMSHPNVASIAHDQRLLRLAENALRGPAVPFRATLFDKSPVSNWHVLWHQDRALPLSKWFDSPEWGPWSEKSGVRYALAPAWALERVVALRVHLDTSDNSNGPLRLIPGSHTRGVLSESDIRKAINGVPAETCLVGRGGVLAMRPLVLHSSIKASGDDQRRVIHFEYANGLKLGNEARLCVA
ncbi:MAG TPA: phytanoyl-CoA dioxygenase family protein [Pyrinomonadaceae bacterium]|nr:phytanoyl-CoA dioxygenase family protein [Pyrinomonadaceae bacterium]